MTAAGMLGHTERMAGVNPKLIALVYSAVAQIGGRWGVALGGGVRTDTEQRVLWCKGRTQMSDVLCRCREQPCNQHPLGLEVTQAKYAWETPHGARLGGGCAVDLVAYNPNGTPDWTAPRYAALGAYAKGAGGFEWGGDFKTQKGDVGHIQIALWKAIPLLNPVKKEAANGG